MSVRFLRVKLYKGLSSRSSLAVRFSKKKTTREGGLPAIEKGPREEEGFLSEVKLLAPAAEESLL